MALDPAADALAILTNEDDFGQAITVTAPDATTAGLVGFGLEIGQTIDGDTGQPVAGAQASISLPLGPFRMAFGAGVLPRHIPSGAPWVVAFKDAAGDTRTYKITDVMPDLRLGVLTCMLEVYGT